MNTPHGFFRAQLQLKQIDVGYSSLKEMYLLSAMYKERKVNTLKDIATFKAMASQDGEDIVEAIQAYMEELMPELGRERDNFLQRGQAILDQVAGETFTLGGE